MILTKKITGTITANFKDATIDFYIYYNTDTTAIDDEIIVTFDSVTIADEKIEDYEINDNTLRIEIGDDEYTIYAHDLLDAIDATTPIEDLLEKDTININNNFLQFLKEKSLLVKEK